MARPKGVLPWFVLRDGIVPHPYSATGVRRSSFGSTGLSAYKNQLNKVTLYGQDVAGRKTSGSNANGQVITNRYNAAGDLTSLKDGKGQNTSWYYDADGRLTQTLDHNNSAVATYGYDANNRLTSRYTPAKGTTIYSYDNASRLTFINFPTSTDVTFGRDGPQNLDLRLR